MTSITLTTRQAAVVLTPFFVLSALGLGWGLSTQNTDIGNDCAPLNLAGEVIEKLTLAGCPSGGEFDITPPAPSQPADPCRDGRDPACRH